ncbi:hypothetical protein DM01DRAFT_1330021 [Hesseltinella vesiculosa]|uniref:Uncharacterized protein n=1 Tax=Hesseltinella vesiculosa TaxID=101127 RepID=A0A1X2G2E8_9FUNG|nr:hypothetical protein DM01DRAFT_1330021 [Hesseltinella vesiculosa]
MFFYEEFNDENIARLSKKIDDMGNVELCYLEDPTEPLLVSKLSLNGAPHKYKLYLPSTVEDLSRYNVKRA